MEEEHDTAQIVEELSKEDDTNLVCEGEECHIAPVDPTSERPSVDTQNFEVVHSPEPEPQIVEES